MYRWMPLLSGSSRDVEEEGLDVALLDLLLEVVHGLAATSAATFFMIFVRSQFTRDGTIPVAPKNELILQIIEDAETFSYPVNIFPSLEMYTLLNIVHKRAQRGNVLKMLYKCPAM